MVVRSKTALVSAVLLAGVVVAVAFYLLAPEGDSTRTNAQIEKIKNTCDDRLSALFDENAFAGAEVPGSPAHALAEFIKWSWIKPLEWFGRRGDLKMIITYGTDFDNCYLLDTQGYVVASHSRHKDAQSTRWLRRSDVDGRVAITVFERDPAVLDGAATAWYTLGVDPASKEIARLALAGQSAGERSVDGAYRYDETGGRLELDVRREEKIEMAADGLLIHSLYRTCFDPDAPCDEPWETTRYTYDDAGNLTWREMEFGSDRQNDELVSTLNGRGDWVEWRFNNAPSDNQATRRAIFYRK